MSIDEKPTTYVEWRAVYQREIFSLGYGFFVEWKCSRNPVTRFLLKPRRLYKQLRRLERIQKHLDECRDCPTFYASVAQWAVSS